MFTHKQLVKACEVIEDHYGVEDVTIDQALDEINNLKRRGSANWDDSLGRLAARLGVAMRLPLDYWPTGL